MRGDEKKNISYKRSLRSVRKVTDQVCSVLIYGPSAKCAGHKSEEKNEVPKLTERTKRTRVVRYLSFHYLQFNPLIPKSDQHPISPYNITPESCTKVMRIKEMISCKRSCRLLHKFFLVSTLENVWGEQYGVYLYWCQDVKG